MHDEEISSRYINFEENSNGKYFACIDNRWHAAFASPTVLEYLLWGTVCVLFRTPWQTSDFSPTIVFRRAAACSFFFLLLSEISKLDQVNRTGNVTHGCISRNFLDVVDGDYDIPLCDRHEIALRPDVVF